MKSIDITITITDTDELWSSVFGACAEMYDWWNSITFDQGSWEETGIAVLVIDDPDFGEHSGKTITKRVGIDDIAAALGKLIGRFQFGIDPNHLDLDAASADALLQIVMFDDIVFG